MTALVTAPSTPVDEVAKGLPASLAATFLSMSSSRLPNTDQQALCDKITGLLEAHAGDLKDFQVGAQDGKAPLSTGKALGFTDESGKWSFSVSNDSNGKCDIHIYDKTVNPGAPESAVYRAEFFLMADGSSRGFSDKFEESRKLKGQDLFNDNNFTSAAEALAILNTNRFNPDK